MKYRGLLARDNAVTVEYNGKERAEGSPGAERVPDSAALTLLSLARSTGEVEQDKEMPMHHYSRRYRMIILAFTCLVVVFAFKSWLLRRGPKVVHGEVQVGSLMREYRMAMPRSRAVNQPIPVIFALHGALDTTDEMADHTGLDQFATKHQVLVVYLQGRLRNWPPSIPEDNPDLLEPDFEFLDAMCELLQREHHADADRTYLVGVSQGGAMTNAMVAGRSERLAAAVSVCGWLPAPLGETPLDTKHKCPMLFVVGAADSQVSPANGRAAYDAFKSAGHSVVWHEIEGFGHGWPKTEEFANLMWDFLTADRRSP